MNFIFHGTINSGKSTAVDRFIQTLTASGYSVGGIVSLPVFDKGIKVGYNALSLSTGIRIPLAKRKIPVSPLDPGDIEIGQWVILGKGFQFCCQQIEEDMLNYVHLIVIDEIGPLELQGKGFRPLLDRILLKEPASKMNLLLVVRDNLVKSVQGLYPGQSFITVNAQDNLMDKIVPYLVRKQ